MPSIDASKFILMNEQYGEGIAINTYQNEISLVSARKKEETGEIFMQWVYPVRNADGKSVPGEKMLPWKIRLGSREQALTTLVKLAGILGVTLVVDKIATPPAPTGTPQPQEFGTSPSGGADDDIPF